MLRSAVGTILIAISFAIVVAGAAAQAASATGATPVLSFNEFTLTIDLSGDGTGRLETTDATATPDGLIDCHRSGGITSGTCTFAYVTTQSSIDVHILVSHATGSVICYQLSCYTPTTGDQTQTLTLTSNTSDDDWSFSLIGERLTLTRSGAGTGNVTSNPLGIDCGSNCSSIFKYGTKVQLTASAGGGSYLKAWSGACAGHVSPCSFTITAPTSVGADFEMIPPPTLPPATHAPTAPPTPHGSPASGPSPASGFSASPAGSPGSSSTQGVPPPIASPPSPSTAPIPAVVSGGTDLTPVMIGIVVAGLLIALGIGFAGYELRRRGGSR